MSNLTQEQEQAVSHVIDSLNGIGNSKYTGIEAIAGSGKSSTLLALANRYQNEISATPNKILYMVYNKSMKIDAENKGFPNCTEIRTIHSLAYKYTVADYGFKITGSTSPRDIKTKGTFDHKRKAINLIESFFVSKELTLKEHFNTLTGPKAKAYEDPAVMKIAQQLVNDMASKKRPATHGFYLKFFHRLLVGGNIDHNYDVILFDEAQDASKVALEIFKLIDTRHKVFVGDSLQNIYSFNDTVSIFNEIINSERFCLTQSFRVRSEIAKAIESFCIRYIDNSIKFKGIEISDESIETKAFIGRTNSSLISKALELNNSNVEFNLTRDITSSLKLAQTLISIDKEWFKCPTEYAFLKKDYETYKRRSVDKSFKERYPSKLSYFRDVHSDDKEIASSARVIAEIGPLELIKIGKILSSRELDVGANITLTTSHSSKGLEFDEVILLDDMNDAAEEVLDEIGFVNENKVSRNFAKLKNEQKSEIYLYYVAISRARKKIVNARLINGYNIGEQK